MQWEEPSRSSGSRKVTPRAYWHTRAPTPVFEYTVAEYDTLAEAIQGAESFIQEFSQQLEEGAISPADPEIEAIQETIYVFRGQHHTSFIDRVLHLFGKGFE